MRTRFDSPDARALLEATRSALVACSDGLDVSAVEPETPLAALVFDSLMALNFIASLEGVLGVKDLPFERWLAEHSECADAVTIGSLVDWLHGLPEMGATGVAAAGANPRAAGPRGQTSGGSPEDG